MAKGTWRKWRKSQRKRPMSREQLHEYISTCRGDVQIAVSLLPAANWAVLGVDAAVRQTGFAVVATDGRLLCAGLAQGTGLEEINTVLDMAEAAAERAGQRLFVVIEDQYLGQNAKTYALLVSARTRWEVEIARRDLPFALCPAQKWQKMQLGQGLARRELKARSIMRASATWPAACFNEKDDDITDAALMAEFVCNLIKQNGRE